MYGYTETMTLLMLLFSSLAGKFIYLTINILSYIIVQVALNTDKDKGIPRVLTRVVGIVISYFFVKECLFPISRFISYIFLEALA